MVTIAEELRYARRSYAVVWSGGGVFSSGRLERTEDALELSGRVQRRIPISSIVAASVLRGRADRLRGLPVLRLVLDDGTSVRIASLEGAGCLHELLASL
jgi:hypothetical protein